MPEQIAAGINQDCMVHPTGMCYDRRNCFQGGVFLKKSFDKLKDITGLGPLSRRLKGWVVEQPRRTKRWLVMGIDLCCLLLVMAVMIYMRSFLAAGFEMPTLHTLTLLFALPFLSVVSMRLLGMYRLVTRHVGRKGLWRTGYSLLVAIMFWSMLVFLAGWRGAPAILPRTVVVSYFVFGWLGILSMRKLAHWWLRDRPLVCSKQVDENKKNVLIYGAGDAGLMLLRTLDESGAYNVIGFFDDDKSLLGMKISGYKVYRFDLFDRLIREEGVREVFIAIPSLSRLQKRKIINRLEPFPVKVRILPELTDIATGRISISDLKNIEIKDLMGRDSVQPIKKLMQQNITGKAVMVTGAGGSIGSEIVRQVFQMNPTRLILFELSEHALYRIEMEMAEKLEQLRKCQSRSPARRTEPVIISVLGSVDDEKLVRQTIISQRVDTVYHAAAYKHIPILESNVSAALRNNTLATAVLARVVQDCGVERMVLISSDKAVRPANVKGASNRLQEMILQAMAQEGKGGTIFTAVRFGNVLDSSGSVVPRFREQIKNGGPVTITHPDIIRYFMSILEAAELVIQAGAMARSGELYVLDMGKPVKIDDLARSMIRLSGREVADDDNPDGDIELKYVGLRPGDKMHEELLIDGDLVGTSHPYIMRLNEAPDLSLKEVEQMLEEFREALENDDFAKIFNLLGRYVEGYTPVVEDAFGKKRKSDHEADIVAFPPSSKLHQ